MTLVIIGGKQESLESRCVPSWPTKRVGMAKRGGGCPAYLTGYRIVCGTRFLSD